ncbi:hypothetical protein [Methylorubrum suomiense]|uniref:Histidine kinase-, DNA gyrase B-, and HSP90-like ATPase n=1 Tax=Methylorubrum suomiense TaxID=144191 RepID=A0ABQ4V243_9HYPH|nr:hypothetical protein [Methylorubrum suomiense]GJE78149.1 hypothetical protein BGCPKDLD_4760 [Methylorubrum suomiense]
MRMVHAIQESHTEGAQAVKQTGVGGDAKVVYALLTGMVSDKVVYPVREYATNAWEVSPAGKPFEIELPTRFNLQYSIRDFGPGLPHRFMMDRYAKIGESTKDGDDDAVGGWGFGSKAALAYLMRSDGAGSFTVTSRFRGFRRVYIIGVSDTGKIQIQFLGEWPLEPEDRGTGLEIVFPVRPDDIGRFHEHAKNVLWSFEPRPRITPAIDFGEPRVLHRGDGWTVYDAQTVPFSGPQVKLGPVMYPIAWHLAPSVSNLLTRNTAIVFDAKIGTISVSASREALQYDDRTEAGLSALFQHYDADWMAKARAEVDAQDTYFRAYFKAWDIARSLGSHGWGMCRAIGWRGFEFDDSLFRANDPIKACRWPELKQSFSKGSPVAFRGEIGINPGELGSRRVVIQHATSRSLERFEAAGLDSELCLWVRVKRADLDLALERMGRPDYVVLDDIKLPPRPKGERVKRPESEKQLKVLDSNFERAPVQWIDTDEELLFVHHNDRRGNNRHLTTYCGDQRRKFRPYVMASWVRDARQLGLLDEFPQIILLNPGDQPPEHWQHLGDHLAELIEAKLDPSQVAPTIPWSESSFPSRLREVRSRKLDLGCAPQELRDLVYDMVAMSKNRDTLERDDNDHDRLAALLLSVSNTDVKTVAKDPTKPIRDRWEAFIQAYPLFEVLFTSPNYRGSWDTYGSDYKFNNQGQKAMDHYFALLSK